MARLSFLIVFLQFVLHRVEMATIPTEIGLQTDLETLSWNSKGYTGTIPTQFGLLTKMSSFFLLNSNSLSKAIPTELGGMTGMTNGFYLDSNRLSKAIPTELGGLTGITQYFDLSSNRLCGSVPADVASIVSSASDSDVTTGNFVGPTPCAAVSGLVALVGSKTSIPFNCVSFSFKLVFRFFVYLFVVVDAMNVAESPLTLVSLTAFETFKS